YTHGALGRGIPFEELNRRADIGERARAAGTGEAFHRAIRRDLYDPRVAEFIAAEATELQKIG
ncbi:MAG: hypothetical protein RL291_1003, partial [Pseudomonadota bacterium]